jgi:hypothetical protein
MQTKIRFDIKFHTNLQIIFLIYHFLLVHAGNVWMREEHGYKLGTKSGVLRGLYTRNQFELSDNNFLAKDTVQLISIGL